MLLEGSALPLLVDKAVAPPSSLELHQGKGIWKEEGGSKCLVRLLLWHVKQPEWSRSGFRNTLVSSHTVVNLGRKLVSHQLNSPCSSLADTGSLADPPETTFPSLNPSLRSSVPCTERDVSAEIFPTHCSGQWARDMLSRKKWRDHDCKQLLLPEPSCFSTKLVYRALPRSQPWKGCMGLGSAHRAE